MAVGSSDGGGVAGEAVAEEANSFIKTRFIR